MSDNQNNEPAIDGVPVSLIQRHYGLMMTTMQITSTIDHVSMEELTLRMLASFGFIPAENPGEFKINPKAIQGDEEASKARVSQKQALVSIAWQTAKWQMDGDLPKINEMLRNEIIKEKAEVPHEVAPVTPAPDEADDFDKESNVLSLDFKKNKKNTIH